MVAAAGKDDLLAVRCPAGVKRAFAIANIRQLNRVFAIAVPNHQVVAAITLNDAAIRWPSADQAGLLALAAVVRRFSFCWSGRK
jgi:hypothetical protein